MEKNLANGRVLYFDCLRICAIVAVMILHMAGQNWAVSDVKTSQWHAINFYDAIVRWGVPVFVMISGALFLNRSHSIKKLFTKNILRIVTAFLFWSVLYAMVGVVFYHCSIIDGLGQMIQGHYHMWFLFMIVGLYLIVPFVERIVASEELTKYFLVLSLVFTFVLPQAIDIISLKYDFLGHVLATVYDKSYFHFTLGFVSYFVLGYFLHKVELSSRQQLLIYVLGILGFVSTVVFSALLSMAKNTPEGMLYNNFTVNVMLEGVSIFVFFKYHVKEEMLSQKVKVIIQRLSRYSFGAYLVHVMILELLENCLGINTLSIHPLVSVPLIGIFVFILSFGISGILNHIPVLKKYIV